MWNETDKNFWEGEPPGIKLVVDPPNEWILLFRCTWNEHRQKQKGKELYDKFLKLLSEKGVIEATDEETKSEEGDGFNKNEGDGKEEK